MRVLFIGFGVLVLLALTDAGSVSPNSVVLQHVNIPDGDDTNGEWPIKLIKTRHGRMIVVPQDVPVAVSLIHYGQWEQKHLDVLVANLQPGDVVLDVGGHIGTFALAFANAVGPTGRVVSFEPQPLMFKMLVANQVMNGHDNVETHQWAAGAFPSSTRIGRPQVPQGEACLACMEIESQKAYVHVRENVDVPVVMIDSLNEERVNLIKLDVEGYEFFALLGAYNTIMQFRDDLVMSVENNRDARVMLPMMLIDSMGFNQFRFSEKCHQDDAWANGDKCIFQTYCGVTNTIAITGNAPLPHTYTGDIAAVCEGYGVDPMTVEIPMKEMVFFMLQQAAWSGQQGIDRWQAVWEKAANLAVKSFFHGTLAPLAESPYRPLRRTQPLVGPLPFSSFLHKLADFLQHQQDNLPASNVVHEMANVLVDF